MAARTFVTGAHQYTPDMRLPGMLHGKVLRPPSFGATIVAYDDSAAKTKPGVTMVHDGDFVGAAAPTVHEAQKALDAVKIKWKEVPQISNRELFSYLKQNGPAGSDKHPIKEGSLQDGYGSAAHRLDATFHFLAASATSRSRAAEATRRNSGVMLGVDRLPNVPASNGVSVVSAVTMRTLSNGTRSSSAMV